MSRTFDANPSVGVSTYRALHSGFIDYLTTEPEDVRSDFVRYLHGLTFDRFALACEEGTFRVRAAVSDDDTEATLAMDARDASGHWSELFTLPHNHAGVDPKALSFEARMRFDTEVKRLEGFDVE